MFTKIITAITLAVICISAVSNLSVSAFGGSISKTWTVKVTSDRFNGTVKINPTKTKKSLAKVIGQAINSQGGFICKSTPDCSTLIRSTDLVTSTYITPVNGEYTVVLELINPVNLMN